MRPVLQNLKCLLAATLAAVLLAGCDRKPEQERLDLSGRPGETAKVEKTLGDGERVYIFGFDPRRTMEEDVRQFGSLLNYLEEATGLQFKLRYSPKASNIVDDLGRGRIDFAAIGAGSYIPARDQYGVIPLARGVNAAGKSEYQSIIVTLPKSPLQTIADLRGKRLALGAVTSTQGHVIPRIVLAEHGLGLQDLLDYEYMGSHYNCAMAVVNGRFDACGMQDTLARELVAAGKLRILQVSAYYPSSCLAANKEVAPEALAKVQKALLDMEPKGRHATVLVDWDRSEMANGFVAARNEDYAELRRWSYQLGIYDKPE